MGEEKIEIPEEEAEVVKAAETAEPAEPAEEKHSGKKNKDSKKLKEMKEQLDAANERTLRLLAEYDNYKKRTARELDSRYADAKLDVLTEMLSVIDNFERAMSAECSDESYKQGVELIFKQFTDLLAKQGVEEIEAEGKEFDPNLHNAVMHVDDENYDANTICEVFQKGYKMGDKVLRHSLVKVAN